MNARRILANTPTNNYLPPVTNLAFHDLTTDGSLPPHVNSLLGLGLKYIPTPKLNITDPSLDSTLSRFDRDFGISVYFSGSPDDTFDSSSRDAKLRTKSIWRAPLPPTIIDTRLEHFCQAIRTTFKRRKTTPNLTPLQQKTLRAIKQNPNITIASADKGLGPVGLNTTQYIKWGMQHLSDTTTYTIISTDTAHSDICQLRRTIIAWTQRHRSHLTDDIANYIYHHLDTTRADPFGYFYLLIKLHKTPISTRPVCSDCASLPHALGKWVDIQLQPIVQSQTTYFKNSLELKKQLCTMTLPPNARIFTYDAISMYTNIDTDHCIARLSDFLHSPTTLKKFPHISSPTALVDAITIVMKNNRMKFGDIIVQQHKGIAMGMAPAPTIANLYVAIFEQEHILTHPPRHLHYLRRFIDDGFGIWLLDDNDDVNTKEWNAFQSLINTMGLTWEFTPLADTTVFMDLTIKLTNGNLTTSLYAKPKALHLYIPPMSCHTPGITTGLIFGHVLRVHQLCSHQADIDNELLLFHQRLIARGHNSSTTLPLLLKAIQKAEAIRDTTHSPSTSTSKDDDTRSQLFFHLPYHPANPPSSHIQHLWRTLVATPPNEPPLTELTNKWGQKINIKQLTIAYSRAPNIGNLLSCRILKDQTSSQNMSDTHPHTPRV